MKTRWAAVFVFYGAEVNSVKINLLPKAPTESFWDALWLGIQPFLCFYGAKLNSVKLNLLPKAPIESFWDALWLGIQPRLCFYGAKLKALRLSKAFGFFFCPHPPLGPIGSATASSAL